MCNGIAYNKKSYKRNFVSYLTVFGILFSCLFLNFAFFIKSNNLNNMAFAEGGETTIGEEIESSVNDILNDIDFSELDEFLEDSNIDLSFFGKDTFKEVVSSVINGEDVVSIDVLFGLILNNVKTNFNSFLKPLIYVIAVVIICSLFKEFKPGKISGISDIIYFLCFSLIIIILSGLLSGVIGEAKSAIVHIQKQMGIIFPILLSLVTALGGMATVATFSPLLVFLTNVVSYVFSYVLLPLFSLSIVLSVVGNLSEMTKLNKFNSFVKSLFKWIIGVVFAVFMSVLSIKSFVASSGDGLSIKAAKYAIKNYIPMLGGYISEGFEVVKAGSLLIKNATGLVSLLLLLSSIITPVLLVAVLELMFKFAAGVVEIVGDGRSSNLLYSLSNSLKLLVVILVGIALMYFLTIFILMCSASSLV